MSFYFQSNTKEERDYYRKMLALMGALSNLFSNSQSPYLASRVTENIFCKYLNAKNLARDDSTADAVKRKTGIGIKTWTGSSRQKIAEFNAQRKTYSGLSDSEIVYQVAKLRNERIALTMRRYGLESMIYHCTIRKPGAILIKECPLRPIELEKIRNITRKNNVIAFEDSVSKYSFNLSKSTLYKDFSDLEELDSLSVEIIDDPFALLEERLNGHVLNMHSLECFSPKETIYLPLYSFSKNKGKYVPEKAQLNIRFAGGRKRDLYECYIPISVKFNRKHRNFFPSSNSSFTLILPDGHRLSAKICQENDKALMTNPNKALGHWLIDDILKINPNRAITYDDLSKYGIDSVKITKESEGIYSIDFASIGSYERFMGLDRSEDD